MIDPVRAHHRWHRATTVDFLRERYLYHLGHGGKLHLQGYLPNLDPILTRESEFEEAHPPPPEDKMLGSPPAEGLWGDVTASPALSEASTPSISRPFLAAGSMKSSVFNLTSATLGAGALSIPFAVSDAGVVIGVALLVFIGILSILATVYVVHVINFTELKTFEEMAVRAAGRKFALFVEMNIILFCFGTAVGYLISVGDIAETIIDACFERGMHLHGVDGASGHQQVNVVIDGLPVWQQMILDRRFILFVVTFGVLLPLSVTEKLNELRFTCFLGVAAIVFLSLAVAIQFLLQGMDTSLSSIGAAVLPPDLFRPVRAFSLVIFAYSCQSNVPAIYCELENQNCRRMVKVSRRSTFLCFITYALMGVCGFLSWGDGTGSNIMQNYAATIGRNVMMALAFAGMAFAVTFAYPMNIFPCRYSIEMVLFFNQPQLISRTVSMIIASSTVALTFVIAVFLPSISIVFEIIGSTSGAFVSFILPGYFFIKLCPGPVTHKRKLRALGLVVLGVVVAILGTCMSLMDILSIHQKPAT